MPDSGRQPKLLRRYRHVISSALFVFLVWTIYQTMKRLMFWAARAFDLSGPDIENLAMLLSLPFLAAVWFSHAWVMGRIDKFD